MHHGEAEKECDCAIHGKKRECCVLIDDTKKYSFGISSTIAPLIYYLYILTHSLLTRPTCQSASLFHIADVVL